MSDAQRLPVLARAGAGDCLGLARMCLGSAALVELAADWTLAVAGFAVAAASFRPA